VRRAILAAVLAAAASTLSHHAGVARPPPPPIRYAASASPAARADACGPVAWPHWARYVQAFASPDGRIIDRTDHDRTTSEGQAYALLFALIADDRALFDRVLRWTEDNLARGSLAEHLPAWHWGRRDDDTWGVVDANSASDADVWMAYALLEAGRLWSEPRYGALAQHLLANVAAREVADLPALGQTLLPAPRGFALDGGRAWRLNPSYVPPQVLRRLAREPGPWAAVRESAIRMIRETAQRGVVADWVLYAPGRGFAADPVKGRVGSYDAIRSYLWVGMLPPADPARRALAPATGGLLRVLDARGILPERIDVSTLRGDGRAPVGFYAALLPLALARDPRAAHALEERIDASARDGLYGDPPTYYDQNLVLFARGFMDGRFRFAPDGALQPAWEARCASRR
jgi:endoglucanase